MDKMNSTPHLNLKKEFKDALTGFCPSGECKVILDKTQTARLMVL
jgi:hypothetical protein